MADVESQTGKFIDSLVFNGDQIDEWHIHLDGESAIIGTKSGKAWKITAERTKLPALPPSAQMENGTRDGRGIEVG